MEATSQPLKGTPVFIGNSITIRRKKQFISLLHGSVSGISSCKIPCPPGWIWTKCRAFYRKHCTDTISSGEPSSPPSDTTERCGSRRCSQFCAQGNVPCRRRTRQRLRHGPPRMRCIRIGGGIVGTAAGQNRGRMVSVWTAKASEAIGRALPVDDMICKVPGRVLRPPGRVAWKPPLRRSRIGADAASAMR